MILPEHITYRYHRIKDLDLGQATLVLSPGEKSYLSSVSHEKRKQEFIAGRFIARQQAASLLHTSPAEVNLAVQEDGSLDLADTPYSISLAHTREGVCSAIARESSVGIDLELIRPRHENLYQFILDPSEYHLLESLPMDRDRILILCWTLKEATLKGMRSGFRCSPKKLRLSIDTDAQTAEITASDGEIWVAHFEEFDNAYLSIAYPCQSESRDTQPDYRGPEN